MAVEKRSGEPFSLPQDIESSKAKLIYTYICSQDGASIAEIRDDLRMKTVEILPILRTLENKGLICGSSSEYKISDN